MLAKTNVFFDNYVRFYARKHKIDKYSVKISTILSKNLESLKLSVIFATKYSVF